MVAIIALLYWFFGTELGHSIRATGINKNMAKANGINTKTTTIIALVLSNGLVALAGGLLSQFQGFADVNMGRGAIVIGLAAVIIGEVISLGLNTDDLKILTAAIVAVFLGIPYIKSRYDQNHVKTKKEVK